MTIPIGCSCSTGQHRAGTQHQIWEHSGLLKRPMWLRPKTTKISDSGQVCSTSVTVSTHLKSRLLKYKAALFQWQLKKNSQVFLEKQISSLIYIKTKWKIQAFFMCSLASVKSVGKNSVPLQRLKANPCFFPFTSWKQKTGTMSKVADVAYKKKPFSSSVLV